MMGFTSFANDLVPVQVTAGGLLLPPPPPLLLLQDTIINAATKAVTNKEVLVI